jgi:hypothetical protein
MNNTEETLSTGRMNQRDSITFFSPSGGFHSSWPEVHSLYSVNIPVSYLWTNFRL